MTQVTDPKTGSGIAMRSQIDGEKNGEAASYVVTFDHEDTAFCAGCGTGAIAQLILSNRLNKPGVLPVEQALTTKLFLETLHQRKLSVNEVNPPSENTGKNI